MGDSLPLIEIKEKDDGGDDGKSLLTSLLTYKHYFKCFMGNKSHNPMREVILSFPFYKYEKPRYRMVKTLA